MRTKRNKTKEKHLEMIQTTLGTIATRIGSELRTGATTLVTGLADDSRQVEPGDLFCAISGSKADGNAYVADAVKKGAAAVVTEKPVEAPVPVVVVGDTRAALSRAIAAVYEPVLSKLEYVGVTGTNGKTTTTYLTAAVLRAGGIRTAVTGTLGTLRDDGSRVPCKNTTPGPLDLMKTIEALVNEGYQALVMEVSSQAVVQHRADFLPFRSAVWTNLSPEHFELHGNLETYRGVKVSYIAQCDAEARTRDERRYASVLNLADPSVGHFLAPCAGRVFGFTLGRVPDGFAGVLVRGEAKESGIGGSRMTVHHGGQSFDVTLQLGGRFNLENALAATCVGLQHGVAPAAIAAGLAAVQKVPGRFQRVASDKRRVLIDYAHTSEGLENLLSSCRPLLADSAGKLFVVFGCGGDRDNTKRSRMGKSAASYADICIITNDNPRTEDPRRITDMILEGIGADDRQRCRVEHDRRRAIELALHEAGPNDLVVVAGKGHEDYQLVGDKVFHFDDYEVVQEVLATL
jgi:UDP-N-acetylmuramoyl-L-alanyl-D-glutamate--2,6-diaminopimelate ligase